MTIAYTEFEFSRHFYALPLQQRPRVTDMQIKINCVISFGNQAVIRDITIDGAPSDDHFSINVIK